MTAMTRYALLALLTVGLEAGPLEAQQTPAQPPLPASTALNLAALGSNAPGRTALETNVLGPKIRFATPIYDFGKAKSGDPVKYTYIFTNIGDQMLELTGVQPQCGCTATGEWTRRGFIRKVPVWIGGLVAGLGHESELALPCVWRS